MKQSTKYQKYSDEDMINALRKFRGNLSSAAEYLGCERSTIYDRMKISPAVQAAKDEAEDHRLDLYEAAIDKAALEDRDVGAIKYVLSTRGRKRGYSEKQEVDITGTGITLQLQKVEFAGPDDRDD